MMEYCKLAAKYNMQVVTHAIGDGAVEKTMDCYQEAFIDGKNKLRHALVHCQITDMDLLKRIAALDVLPMVQPVFLDYDMTVVEDRVGKELASTSYAFKTMEDLGCHVSYGTDSPVEDCNPFESMYAAITRRDLKGSYMGVQGLDPAKDPDGCFVPSECVDVFTAVDAYTIESAYHEFREDVKGRIKNGYYADLIVLDKNLKLKAVFVGGKRFDGGKENGT